MRQRTVEVAALASIRTAVGNLLSRSESALAAERPKHKVVAEGGLRSRSANESRQYTVHVLVQQYTRVQ